MQTFPLNQNTVLIAKKQVSTHTPQRTVDAANTNFAIHKIICLRKILLRLTEAPTFVEATQAGVAMSHLWHSFLYALSLTAQIFPKITAFATKKSK